MDIIQSIERKDNTVRKFNVRKCIFKVMYVPALVDGTVMPIARQLDPNSPVEDHKDFSMHHSDLQNSVISLHSHLCHTAWQVNVWSHHLHISSAASIVEG